MPDPMTGPALDAVAEYLEQHEPDEWEEPGRLLARSLRCIRLPRGKRIVPVAGTPVRDSFHYRIFTSDPCGRPHWVITE